MGPSDVVIIITLIVLILLSAFFSSAETALTTVSKLRMRALADDGNKNAKRVLKLIDNQSKMLSAILICNNIVNLSASSLATSYAFTICHRNGLSNSTSLAAGIATGILTIVLLIFGEITPKHLATINSDKLSLSYSRIILFFTQLFTPIIFIVNKISHFVLFIMRVDINNMSKSITEDELRTFVDVSHEEGVIESEERQMITNIVDFGDSLVKDVMIPRLDITMVDIDISCEELMNTFVENKYARLPVYEESIDNIIGIINLKDFVFSKNDNNNLNLRDLLREAHITYEYKNVSELFLEMRRDSIPMTIVLDEYGALAGLITIEDLIEEIVGELRDEYDTDEEDEIQPVAENEYHVLGSTPLDDIEETIGIKIETNDYDSIAGHLINLLEHFPEEGETVEDNFATYIAEEVDGNRVDKVHIFVKPQPSDDEDNDIHSSQN